MVPWARSGPIFGKVGDLPSDNILCATTMCGHGMVAANLVKKMARQVKLGKESFNQAAIELAKPCQCGVFNPTRAEKILSDMIND